MTIALDAIGSGEACGGQNGAQSWEPTWRIERLTTLWASDVGLTGTGLTKTMERVEPRPEPSPERGEDDGCQITACAASGLQSTTSQHHGVQERGKWGTAGAAVVWDSYLITEAARSSRRAR